MHGLPSHDPEATRVELTRLRERLAAAEAELACARAERTRSERDAVESQRFLQAIGANLPALFWIRDLRTGALLYANARWEEILGHPPLIGSDYGQLLAAVHPDERERLRRHRTSGSIAFDEVVGFVDPKGRERWFHLRAFPIPDADGSPHRVAGLGHDVTEARATVAALRELTDQLQASLAEKEVLLAEVHHRVKNNLQIVSSLLSLQARRSTEPPHLDVLRESRGRVTAMALVHEQLHQSTSVGGVCLGRYVDDLADSLFRAYGVPRDRVTVSVDAAGLALGTEVAVPCGLVLHEVLSNAFQHAFPGGRAGTIRIVGAPGPDGTLVVVASDDGVGLPEDFEVRCRASLGTRLIARLMAQLDGTVERTSSRQGTTYRLTMPRCRDPRPPGGGS